MKKKDLKLRMDKKLDRNKRKNNRDGRKQTFTFV